MNDLVASAITELLTLSWLELSAVVFAIMYLLLAVREQISCWFAALISSAIFLVVFWEVRLYMESALQIFYMAMAVYGWSQWRGTGEHSSGLKITTWRTRQHLLALAVIGAATFVSGNLLHQGSDARLPYLDSFTTWASVITTFMVAKKILENWYYWLVIDSVSIFLYLDRGLYFTALLFAFYIVIIIFGWITWLKIYQQSPATA